MGLGGDDKPEFSIGPRSNIHARHISSIFTANVAAAAHRLTFGNSSQQRGRIEKRRLSMSRSLAIYAFIGALGTAGCMSQEQFLASKQPTAIQTATQFEMNCPSANGQVLSQEVTQPAFQGPRMQGEERGLFTIGVAGCNQRRVYEVFCPMGGDSCTALEGRAQQ